MPDPTDSVCLLDQDYAVPAGYVVMTYEYWMALVDYIIRVERIHEIVGEVLQR